MRNVWIRNLGAVICAMALAQCASGPENELGRAGANREVTVADLAEELRLMREDLAEFQEIVEESLTLMRDENRALFESVLEPEWAGATPEQPTTPAPRAITIPRPQQPDDADLEGTGELIVDDAPTPTEPDKAPFTVVKEWGRSPEMAARINGATSLKGLIAAVPSSTSRDKLIELAKQLRTEFAAYDNINIEVFKNADSAEAYAGGDPPNPDHRVLSISKFKDTGRDVALLIEGQQVTPIPFEAASEPAPTDP